jgi:hypothetical protein
LVAAVTSRNNDHAPPGQICSGKHISKILRVSVIENRRKLKLFYRTDASALAQIKEHQLGKRIFVQLS